MPWQVLAQQISDVTGEPFEMLSQAALGGGCINDAYHLRGQRRDYFVKFNHPGKLHMFQAEAAGLRQLSDAKAVRVPTPIACGVASNRAYLVLEYLDLSGRGERHAAIRLGEQLAKLHHHSQAQFGWEQDNTLGSTPQPNQRCADWPTFWREHRLGHQLVLAKYNGISSRVLRKGENLQDAVPTFFTNYQPRASALHGDLWGGNWGVTPSGEPVIFDPAVYFGDRETDLAMTELFGGFSADFYAAYQACWPLDPGYKVRKTLYNLYHILNHFNLFGGSYAGQAETMIDKVLAELR